jgi:hypothetical protein
VIFTRGGASRRLLEREMNGYAIGPKDARYSNEEPNYGRVGGIAETARQAEIPHQIEKLERTLKGCMQGLDTLGAKLEGSVMRSEVPSEGKAEPAGIQATTLGTILQNLTHVAAHLNARIQSMAQRLEV